MINKLLKIFILLYFFAVPLCFSQINQADFKSNGVLTQYNRYLAAVKLNKLIKATSFTYENSIKHGFLNPVNLKGVYMLTIEPDSAFSDPLTFGYTWGNLLTTLNKETDVYGQLFFKLADCTQLPPDSLVIMIKTSAPNVFSYMVYFDKGVKISGLSSTPRGGGPTTTVDVTAEDLNNDVYGYVFPKIAYSDKMMQDLIKGIVKFLKSNDNDKDQNISIKPVYRAPYILFFEARNLHGRITKKDFEDITINLNIARWLIDAKKGAKSSAPDTAASIEYSLSVFYSAQKFSKPGNAENALNAVSNFKYEMTKYGDELFHVFNDIVHENN